MPFLYENELAEASALEYLRDIYRSIILKDVIARHATCCFSPPDRGCFVIPPVSLLKPVLVVKAFEKLGLGSN